MQGNKWLGSRPNIESLNTGSKKRSQSADAATVAAKQGASRRARSMSDAFQKAKGQAPLTTPEYQAARRRVRRELLNKKT